MNPEPPANTGATLAVLPFVTGEALAVPMTTDERVPSASVRLGLLFGAHHQRLYRLVRWLLSRGSRELVSAIERLDGREGQERLVISAVRLSAVGRGAGTKALQRRDEAAAREDCGSDAARIQRRARARRHPDSRRRRQRSAGGAKALIALLTAVPRGSTLRRD
jgi:hypothetical protein